MAVKLRSGLYKWTLLCVPSLLWAGNFILARYFREDFYPYDLAFFRWSLVLVVVWSLYGRQTLSYVRILWNHKGLVCLLAITGVTGFNTLLYYGLEQTTALNAAFINSIIPLMIILMTWVFFRVTPLSIEWLALVISFCGVAIILARGDIEIFKGFEFNVGDLFAVSSALVWAIYSVWVPLLLRKVPPQVLLCSIVMVGWFLLLPYFLYRIGLTLGDFTAATSVIQPIKLSGVGFILYVAILASVVAYRIWNRCVEVAGANLSGLSLNLLPLFASLGGIIFLGERFEFYHLWGGMAIVISLAIAFYGKQKKRITTH
ncbi:EamA family transporter [Spirochaetota bacterium]|nr:EamA family transporter [Spirochaetota bacterium]